MVDEFSSIPSPAPSVAKADVWYQPTALRGTVQNDRHFTVKTTVNNRAEELYLSFPTLGGFRLTNEIPPSEPVSVEKTAIFEPDSNMKINYSTVGSTVVMTGNDGTTVAFKPTADSWCLEVSSDDAGRIITIGADCIYFGYNSDGLVRVKVELPLDTSEVIYGTGERFSGVDQNGKRSLMWNCDACYHGKTTGTNGIDELWRGYKNIPIIHSSRGYTLFYNSTCCAEVDIGYTVSDVCSLDFCENRLDFYFWAGTMSENIVKYTDLTGKSYLPPKWAFGYQVGGSNGFWGVNKTDAQQLSQANRLIASYEELGTPINAVYVEGVNLLGEENGVAALFKEKNIKMLKWNCADTVSVTEAQTLLGGISQDELPMLRNTSTNNSFYGTWIDYADADGIELLRLYLQKYTDIGIYGGMCDFAELVGTNASSPASGLKGDRLHNFYTYGYAKGYNQAYNELTGDQGFFYIRGASAGTQKWTALWAGDQHSTWAGLKMQLSAGLSAASCGFSIWGTDLCGLDGTPTDELYCRALLMGLFSPILRTGGNISKLPTDYETSVQNTYKKVYWLRESLVNKLYSSAVDSNKTGLPMMQAMAIAFPKEKETLSVDDQYLFCDDFLVNPVLDAGVTARNVSLPQGKWYDFWNGAEIIGGQTVEAATTTEDIPVYVKSGAAIPMTLDKSLVLGAAMTDETRTETILVTPPESARVSVYNKDTENSVTYTNTPVSDRHFRLSATMGNDAVCLAVYGKNLNKVTVDGAEITNLDAKPETAEAVGYYIDGEKTLVYLGTEQWTDVDMYFEAGIAFEQTEMPTPENAYFGNVMSTLTESATSAYYNVAETDGVCTYTRNSVSVVPNVLSYQKNVPFLYGGAYKNLTIDFEYSFASGKTGRQWLWVTLGNKTKDRQSAADGSVTLGIGTSAYSASANCQVCFVTSSQKTVMAGTFDATAAHHAKITVSDGDICVFIDDDKVVSFEVGGYTGGYVGIGSNYSEVVISDVTLAGDGFAYYGDSGSNDLRTVVSPEDYYQIDGARYVFKGESGNSWTNGCAMLPVGRSQDFALEFDYQHKGSGERYLWLNWGLEQYDRYNAATGSARLGIGSRDNTLQNGHLNCIYMDTSAAWFDGSGWLDSNKTLSGNFDATASHHVKLTVKDGLITIDFDNGALVKRRYADAVYSGGYVMIGTNFSDTVIENITFTDLDKGDYGTLYGGIASGKKNTEISVFYGFENGGKTVVRNDDFVGADTSDMPFLKVGYGKDFKLEFDVGFAAGTPDAEQFAWIGYGNTVAKQYGTGSGYLGVGISGYSSTEKVAAKVSAASGKTAVGNIDATAVQHIIIVVSGNTATVRFADSGLSVPITGYAGGFILIGTNNAGVSLSDITLSDIGDGDMVYVTDGDATGKKTAVSRDAFYDVSDNCTSLLRNGISAASTMTDGVTAYELLGNANDFYLEFDYEFSPNAVGDQNYIWLTVGASTPQSAVDGQGGEVIGIGNNKYAQFCLLNQTTRWRYIGNYPQNSVHRICLSVVDGVLNVKIDGTAKNYANLLTGYTGGYVLLGVNKSDTAISNIYFESLDKKQYNVFDAHYTTNLESGEFSEKLVGSYWRYNSHAAMLERTGVNFKDNNKTENFSVLTYNEKAFFDLDMRFDYKVTDHGNLYVAVGGTAGQSWMGDSLVGYGVHISQYGTVSIGPSNAYINGTSDEYFAVTDGGEKLFTTMVDRNREHVCRISVRGGLISVTIDNILQIDSIELSGYSGGYVSFAANSEFVRFGNFDITDGYSAETLARIRKSLLLGQEIKLFDYNQDTFVDIRDLVRYKKLSAN